MFCFVLFGEEGHSVTALLKLKIATNIQALDEFEGVWTWKAHEFQ